MHFFVHGDNNAVVRHSNNSFVWLYGRGQLHGDEAGSMLALGLGINANRSKRIEMSHVFTYTF